VLWFRRDLRLHDHPALGAAVKAAGGGRVVPLFVLDPALWEPAGPPRRAWLVRSLRALSGSLDDRLVVRGGDPVEVLTRLVAETGATEVHVTADAGPYGRERDARVEKALAGAGAALVRTGTPYAIGPGTLHTGQGGPFQVFTPFFKAWTRHGWPGPAPLPRNRPWADGVPSDPLPDEPDLGGLVLPEAGEAAARATWRGFLRTALAGYAEQRDRPDVAGTSQLSAHLKYGEVHPRTLLAELAKEHGPDGGGDAVQRFRAELCWREFYADVLWHRPDTARSYLRPEFARMRFDAPDARFDAWKAGRTGFPLVDAGMRQLQAEGWMHNRVRMVAASFLVKDLHVEWQHGARWFMHLLRDGDLASNQHGWQWVAGCGTDAAPYFRVFNPVGQGQRFDPDGEYVRHYVPELAHLPGAAAHQPWDHPDGYAHGYPERIVDHAAERQEALGRYEEIRNRA
jgi:deoxyribodipyrimidine photo-lyase